MMRHDTDVYLLYILIMSCTIKKNIPIKNWVFQIHFIISFVHKNKKTRTNKAQARKKTQTNKNHTNTVTMIHVDK